MKPAITPETCDAEYFIFQKEKVKGRTDEELAQALSAFKEGKHFDRYGLRDTLDSRAVPSVLARGGVVYEVRKVEILGSEFLIHHHIDASKNPKEILHDAFKEWFKTLKLSDIELYRLLGNHFFDLYDKRIQTAFEKQYGSKLGHHSGYATPTNKVNIGVDILYKYVFTKGTFFDALEGVVGDVKSEFESITKKSTPKYILGYSSISMDK